MTAFWSTSSVCSQRWTPGKSRSIFRVRRVSRSEAWASSSSRADAIARRRRSMQRWICVEWSSWDIGPALHRVGIDAGIARSIVADREAEIQPFGTAMGILPT